MLFVLELGIIYKELITFLYNEHYGIQDKDIP